MDIVLSIATCQMSKSKTSVKRFGFRVLCASFSAFLWKDSKRKKKNDSVFGLGKRDKRVVGIRALIDLLYVEKK